MFKKFTWGHGVAVALASFIAFILYMVIYFGQGMKNAEMVSDDYYNDELNYQQVIDAKNNAQALKVKPIYLQKNSGITLTFPNEILPDNKKASLVLYRLDDANLDVKKEVVLDSQNSFTIPGNILSNGSYVLKLKWEMAKKEYQLDYTLEWK